MAFILPWIELVVALYLLVGFFSRVAAWAAIALLAMFVFALMDSLITGNTNHACGCFGGGKPNPIIAFLEGGDSITWWDPIRDIILAALALPIALYGAGPFSVEDVLARRSAQNDYAS